jgi:hypothetical protein
MSNWLTLSFFVSTFVNVTAVILHAFWFYEESRNFKLQNEKTAKAIAILTELQLATGTIDKGTFGGTRRTPLNDLTRVRAVREIRQGSKCVPVGSTGTIVHVYDDGDGYEVEFFDPINDVITADATDIWPIEE